MTAVWTRRRLLSAGALAGCASAAPAEKETPTSNETRTLDEPDGRDLPSNCPTSQGLDVAWPRELNASSVESFVTAYEDASYREKVVEYEPETSLDAYRLSAAVRDGPRPVGGGYELHLAGSGGVYEPLSYIGANRVDEPAGADVVSTDELDYVRLRNTAERAAEEGDVTTRFENRDQIDEFLDGLASRSADFDGLSGPGDSDSLYVDVNGTTVDIEVQATGLHGDYWWDAWYYVDESVVRRTAERGREPIEGELLECREGG